MKRTVFPPNCEVRNSNPSRLLEFVAKQRRVFAEYGFWLSVPLKTQAEKDGHKRYMRDWRRRYRAENRERLSAYHREYWRTVLKPGFASKAEADGDEEKLKRRAERKAAEQKRAEMEARRQEVHAKYGFWLGKPPQTPEEVAGRQRYRMDRDAAYKAAHAKEREAYRLGRNKRVRAQREAKFQQKYHAMLAVDPEKAESFRKKHEKLLVIQNMTHEERVRYRQQKQHEKLRARAEREAALKAKREARQEERRRIKREKSAEAQKAKRKPEKHARREVWLAKCAARRAEAAALAEAERAQAAAFALEREANRAAYLAAKAARRDEGCGMRDEKEPPAPSVQQVPPVPSVPVVPAINVADCLPTRPFRGLSLDGTAPADDEIERETATPDWTDYALADPSSSPIPLASSPLSGGTPPKEPPEVTTGGEPPDDDDERRREREERVRRISEQHGFTPGKKPETPKEMERKIRDAVKKREEAARAAKEAERKALLEQAYTVLAYKVRAWENKKEKMRRSLGLPKTKRDFTPEQRETWNTYLRESRAELEDWLVERMRKEAAKASKAIRSKASPPAEIIAARQERARELEERKRLIREKYGFTLGKKPVTPEEIEGRKRYDHDMEAESRKRRHDKIAAYNREYRHRRRAEAKVKWTQEQWAAWNKRQATRECPLGSPQWLVREVVKYLARENNLSEDAVMQRLMELDGLDFLLKGAEFLGERRRCNKGIVLAAVRALALYLDPDNAGMFEEKRNEGCGTGNEKGT